MSPKRIDLDRVRQEVDLPALGCPPHKDDLTAWMLLQIQLPRFGERPAWRRSSEACRGSHADRGHMALGSFGQGGERLVMKPSPHFPLPTTVPVFHTGLEPRFLHRGKHRHDVEAQTEPHHATDTVTVLVRPLKRRVVVELGVRREPKSAPVGGQPLDHVTRSHRGTRPRRTQAAVQRNPGQDFDVGAAANHQPFDDIEAVEFRTSGRDLRQIPTARRCGPADTALAIKGAATFQNPADRANRGHRGMVTCEQLATDCERPVLAEVAGLFERSAQLQHQILGGPIGSIQLPGTMRPISPGHPVQTVVTGAADPALNRRRADVISLRDRAQRASGANGSYHLVSSVRSSIFFVMLALAECDQHKTFASRQPPVEAAGAVEAQNASTSSLENHRAGFPQLPQAFIDLDLTAIM
jgi:hypothetical protein